MFGRAEGRICVAVDPAKSTLRQHLRVQTRASHDLLDETLSDSDLSEPLAYARFLTTQLAARAGIEAWCDQHCPAELLPPAQIDLLQRDVSQLAQVDHTPVAAFRPDPTIDPIGVAWAVAGSSLGNRTILARLRKAGDTDLPTHFLADPAMPKFWNRLRPQLEQPATCDQAANAVKGAQAVFDHFLTASENTYLEWAA